MAADHGTLQEEHVRHVSRRTHPRLQGGKRSAREDACDEGARAPTCAIRQLIHVRRDHVQHVSQERHASLLESDASSPAQKGT